MTRAPTHGVNADPDGPRNPYKPGPEAMPLRMADVACEKLERLDGIPRFQKHWPLARRDEAIAATVAYLTRYGERFRENAASRAIRAVEPGIPNHEKAILAFDPLDHPATADDVAEGRAIFSLDGPGAEVRRVALPSFPIVARWTKLEVFPDEFHLQCASSMARATIVPISRACRPAGSGRPRRSARGTAGGAFTGSSAAMP